MKKIISIIIIAAIAIAGYKFYVEHKSSDYLMTTGSNEEKITDTLEKFEKSYNEGDFDSLLKCCTGRMKSDLKSQIGLGSSIFGSVVSFLTSDILNLGGDVLEKIWSLGTAMCQMDLTLINIRYLSETEAEVELNYLEKSNGKETRMYILLEEENEAWYVASDFYQISKN